MSASKKELLGNATHWLGEAKRNHLGGKGVGAIFIFFNKDANGSAVCTATVPRDQLRQHLKDILRKLEDGESTIIKPWEN